MPKNTKRAVLLAVVFTGGVFGVFAYQRFATFHNQTFDLAMYARMAWGMAGLDGWEPIMNAHFAGLHLSWVLYPLGLLGEVFGTVEVLLFAQGVCLGRGDLAFSSYRVSPRWKLTRSVCCVVSYSLYPQHLSCGDVRISSRSLAVLPVAWLLDAIDRQSLRTSVVGLFLCFGLSRRLGPRCHCRVDHVCILV